MSGSRTGGVCAVVSKQIKITARHMMPFTGFFIGYNFCSNRISTHNSLAVKVFREGSESTYGDYKLKRDEVYFIFHLLFEMGCFFNK